MGSVEWMLTPDAVKIVLVLFLSFLVGLEREEHKTGDGKYSFGGVRTFPLIGLVGYAIAYLSGDQVLPVVIGLAAVAGFLWISYWHKLKTTATAGATTEVSALATYLAGALVARDAIWVATALSVSGLFLLELKSALEGLTKRIAPEEIRTLVADKKAQDAAQKADLVATLKAAQSEYTEDELKAMDVKALSRLVKVAKVDYSGQSFPRTAAENDVYANPPDPYAAGIAKLRGEKVN